MAESQKTRKQTPRVPSTFLYRRLVPIALGLMTLVLLVILIAVLLPLFGLTPGY